MELLFQEADDDFPSTQAAYEPAADFIARMIDRLVQRNGSRILPRRVTMLNVNFPVPYEEITGVETTQLGDGGDLEIPLFDPSRGFPAFQIPPLPFPPCAGATDAGDFCFVTPGLGFSPDPDPVKRADVNAFRAGQISVTPMDADMTAGFGRLGILRAQLKGLQP